MRTIIAEDDETVAEVERRLLELEGVETEIVDRLDVLLVRAAQEPAIDVILLDLNLLDSSPDQTLNSIRSLVISAPVVVASGYDSPENIARAHLAGVDAFISKTRGLTSPGRLVGVLKRAAKRFRLMQEIRCLLMADDIEDDVAA